MDMPNKLMGVLGVSCVLSFALAAWAFTAGFGFLAAFLIYSLGGSAMVLSASLIAYMFGPELDADAPRRFEKELMPKALA